MVIINGNQFIIIDNSNLEFESLPSVVLQGNIQSLGSENLYQLTLEKNITLILDVDFLAGDTMTDSVIYLLDADMNIVASNDNGYDDASSYIEFLINQTGTYYVRVEGFESNVGTYTLNISKGLFEITPNHTPIANNDTGTVVLGNTITIDVLSNDVGSAGSGILSVESVSATNGTVVINIDNTIDYTPNVDFIGTDTISYTILYSPQEQINHTLTFTNADIFGDYYNDIVAGIDAAMRQWEQYLSTYYPVDIEISITGLIQEGFLASASVEDVFDTNIHDPITDGHIVISSIQYEIGRGIDLNGESVADGVIEISTNYLDEFWFDPTPYDLTDNIPNPNQIDFRSVMMHEIAHLLGFNGNLEYQPDAIYELVNYSPGSLSIYDTYIQWDENLNSFIFTGENAVSAYHDLGFVGNLPLYSEGDAYGSDLYHYGLYLIYSNNPLNDYLMSHSATYGLVDTISLIDLGILADLGYNSYSNTVIANVAVQVVTGSVDAIIYTTDNMLLDNLSLDYFKDGLDTGISTLVEGGDITFPDTNLVFDAVKLSDPAAYTDGILADDAVDVLRDIVNLDSLIVGSSAWHAADVNNDGIIAADDAVAVLRHIVGLDTIDTFDLIDNTTGNRISNLDANAIDVGQWSIVANGDVDQSGGFGDAYVVQVDMV